MEQENAKINSGTSWQAEENYLKETLGVVNDNIENLGREVSKMKADIDEMLEHYHDNDTEVFTILNNTITMHDHMKRALERNEKAKNKPYFGRIVFWDEALSREESLYIGKGGIARDTTHQAVVDWRAPVSNAYYENGLGSCSYTAPDGAQIKINLKLKRTYEIEEGKLIDFFDTEVVANDDLLTKYLAKNKQAVLGEIIATIQKEQNEIIRKSPYHNMIVQGVAGSGKTTVAMHRISYILYNYQERFKPDDFYIVGSNRILLNYITGVLPDLDVYGIRQMTMEQLFVRLLYEDWDEKKYRISDSGKMNPGDSVKGTFKWFRDLEKYCRELEKSFIPVKSVFLNPKQFVEGIRNGKAGVFDETEGKSNPRDLIELISEEAIERYLRQNPAVSIQSKINMLNDRLLTKVKDEFLGKGVTYTESERKAILKAYRGRFGGRVFKRSIYVLYQDFLTKQLEKGYDLEIHQREFDVYDLAALAYLYKRVKETEVISEAHHVVIDEAQDFGMMAYLVLKFCIRDCTYTIMGDISQNIHFGCGLNDWEELKSLLLTDDMDSFGVLKKSYRNTVEISNFATNILYHGNFSVYPVEPIIRHGEQVQLLETGKGEELIKKAADICKTWQKKGLDTIAVVCRSKESAGRIAAELGKYADVLDSDLEKAVFGSGIMVFPVEYTKGLEFDAVLILDPDRKNYPVDDGHARLLYVAATRALHELCILHTGNLTGLIADPLPEKAAGSRYFEDKKPAALKRRLSIVINRPEENPLTEKERKKPELLRQEKERKKPELPRQEGERKKPELLRQEGERKKQALLRQEGERKKQALLQQERERRQQEPARKTEGKKLLQQSGKEVLFGDMPATEILRPAGHSKIDLGVKWVMKQPDGLYMQSRYGVLRLSPVGSAIIRVTFARGQQIAAGINGKIAVNRTDKAWMYREAGGAVELMTDELCLQVDKLTGSIRYLTRDKKLLLSERRKESRQIETGTNGKNRSWLFLEWQKGENLYGMGAGNDSGLKLRGSARYISHGKGADVLPLLLSDKGYGILTASEGLVLCCDVPAYGSYLYEEGEAQMDYYFISGKQQNTILKAYAYLCGKL